MAVDLDISSCAAQSAAANASNVSLSFVRSGDSPPRQNALKPPRRRADPTRMLAVLTMLVRRADTLAPGSANGSFADELALLRPNNITAFQAGDLLDVAAKALFGSGPAGSLAGLTSGLLEDLLRKTKEVACSEVVLCGRDSTAATLDALRFLTALLGNARSLGEGFAPSLLPGYESFGGFPGFQAADLAEIPRGRNGRPLAHRDVKSALLARLRTIDSLRDLLHGLTSRAALQPIDRMALENELAEFETVKRRLGEALFQAMQAEQATNEAILRRLEL